MIVLISLNTMPVMAASITINNGLDEVNYKYNGFSDGDVWNVKLYQDSILKYDFSSTIAQIDQINNTWHLAFSSRGPDKNGVTLCVFAGTYDVVATGTHNSNIISNEDKITISEDDVCSPAIPPIPELSPLVLTASGILGIMLISRRYTKITK